MRHPETKIKAKLNYDFVRRTKSIDEWTELLPTPYDIKKVEIADDLFEHLKNLRT